MRGETTEREKHKEIGGPGSCDLHATSRKNERGKMSLAAGDEDWEGNIVGAGKKKKGNNQVKASF